MTPSIESLSLCVRVDVVVANSVPPARSVQRDKEAKVEDIGGLCQRANSGNSSSLDLTGVVSKADRWLCRI